MRALPAGTITFLFSDIEGSTRLLQQLGDRYTELLVNHRRTLREIWLRHGGVEVGTDGDSFFVAFTKAADAAAAASDTQAALAGGEITVRIGLHTGEPVVVDDDYAGLDVHRAARIASTAHGRQVVLSERTRELLGDEFELRDLGLHRLKDLTAPEKLFQLGQGEFPPLRSLNATNLPTQPALLIGRQIEIAELVDLVSGSRVVTLTGPGGTGKTRLSLQVAAEVVDRFVDGVFWVPLAALTDPELVVPTIAGVLGAQAGLADHIGVKRMLLLLDNLEQILLAAPSLAELLGRCNNLHLLATTRAPLRIEGEREYRVEPLPDADAVALFRERAVSAEPEDVVMQICRRLDRLPLAVELAAARTRIFSPTQLLERLEQRLPLLEGGRRDLPDRHRTLRATIDWSFDLLPSEARRLFARLAVFAGGFDIEAAEAVCDARLGDLECLVEQSLLRFDDERFWMLETIREYALEVLAAFGESESIRGHHARFFLELAEERVALGMRGQAVGRWVRHRRRNIDNLRGALAWTLESGRAEDALRLCNALADVWEIEGEIEEGLRWFERAFKLAVGVDPHVRASALQESGQLMLYANRGAEAIGRLEESVAAWRSLDAGGLAGSLRALASALGSPAAGLARTALHEALEISLSIGDRAGECRILHLLGEMARDEGAYEEGARLLERSIAIAQELKAPMFIGGTTHSLGDLELDRDDLDRADALYRASLTNAVECGLLRHKVYCLAGLAAVARRRGEDERAARLWAAVERAEESLDFRVLGVERQRYERALEHLPVSTEQLEIDEAVKLALHDIS